VSGLRNWFILKSCICSITTNQKEVCCIVIHMHLEAEFTAQEADIYNQQSIGQEGAGHKNS